MMAATERPLSPQEKSEIAESEAKTIFNILSKLKESDSDHQSEIYVTKTTLQLETDDDILILKKDPHTNQSTINKSAYLKLHRNVSPNRNSTIDKIKERYEYTDEETQPGNSVDSPKQSETVESLKHKYSPSGLGYTKPQPAPKPRRSKLSRSQILSPTKKAEPKTVRHSLNIEKSKHKDVNSNHLQDSKEDLSGEDEFVTIITRSDSEESILKFQKELSAFTMDKKKRANSFRRIFSVFSNKDKKKKQEDKNKSHSKENGESYTDNFHNESNSFSRQSPYRHTTGTEAISVKSNINKVQRDSDDKVPNQYNEEQLERDYAEMHINQFNQYKQNFEHSLSKKPDPVNKLSHDGYTPMNKPIYKSNDTNNPYMNVPNIRKYIDTSSSASTLESDRSNIYQNEIISRSEQPKEEEVEIRTYPPNSFRPSRISDGRRDTPPRLLETKQDVRLVNPKALIPISSERPLPNPYQNVNRESPVRSMPQGKPLSQSTPTNQQKTDDSEVRRPYLDETYGTVFDSIENRRRAIRPQNKSYLSPKDNESQPRPPSVEPTKLKLPPNREIVALSPRIRSPIPSENVSTEKLIATELLKPRRSPTPTKKGAKEDIPSHQRLEIDIDYPDNIKYVSRDNIMRSVDNLVSKPPVAAKPIVRRLPENIRVSNDLSRMSQASRSSNESVALRHRISQASPVDNPDRIITNAQVHTNSPLNRTPTPSTSLSSQNLSLSPVRPSHINVRPSTPSGSQIPESPKTTPQKEDMRKSVEAYYWKEIKKLKDQENYELYLLQMRYGNMLPYGYAEDPISIRRSRSGSPSSSRNGRRSLSLPRETRPQANIIPEKYYPSVIPEHQAVTNQMQPRSVQQLQFQQQQYFQRNTPERSTIDGSPRKYDGNTNSLYRPIFKRGSLSTPPRQLAEDSLKRKVSFSGSQDQNIQSWPTRNGLTQSPPQRRMDKSQSQGDDEVFLPNTPKVMNENQYLYADSNTKRDLPSEEMYYNTRQNITGANSNGEPMYVLRANQSSVYLSPRQTIENPYGQRAMLNQRRLPSQQQEVLYGQPIDAVKPHALTRHGSVQIQEELYGQRPGPRRMSYQNNIVRPSVPSTPVPLTPEGQYVPRRPPSQQGVQLLRREIIVNDEIFGQFGGYSGPNNNVRVVQQPQNVYASRQSIAEYNSRVRDDYYNRQPQKQVSVTNKVCDIYGQIHDTGSPKIQQSGVLMGQLHQNPASGSPIVVRNSYNQLAGRENFVRNSRLTASANDMYRRVPHPGRAERVQQPYPPEALYGRIEQTQMQSGNGAPTRPLPPVPQKKGAVKGVMRNNMVSDTESGSDASEIQRIINNNSKSKKRGIFGK